MPLEIGLWRVTDRAVHLAPAKMPLESRLEQLILDDPAILETELLLIGHQVLTDHGKFIDILGIDVEGVVHVVELKRDKTPREIVAQALDYASWVQGLSNDDLRDIYKRHNPGEDFDVAFAERFGGTPTPDDLNEDHSITVVASDLDDSTQRIVQYLSSTYSVPIRVMLFRYFSDQGNDYLARTWLVPTTQASTSGTAPQRSTKAAWNGSDWYVAFGMEDSRRNWDDAQRYGFVSAGGGEWYSQTLRKLPVGARIFVYIPGHGYVGIGTVTEPAMRAMDATLKENGQEKLFSRLDLQGDYGLNNVAPSDDEPDTHEYIVPVSWERTVGLPEAFWLKGLFANQHSACKLRHELTLSEVSKAFSPDT